MKKGFFLLTLIVGLPYAVFIRTQPSTLKDAKIEEHNERHERKEPLIEHVNTLGNLPASLTLAALDSITVDKNSPENLVPKRAQQAIAITVSGAFTTLLAALTHLAARECKNDICAGKYGWAIVYGLATLVAGTQTAIVGGATATHISKILKAEEK